MMNAGFCRDINEAVGCFRKEKEAVLLDVRSPREYASGHIPGSVNIPLQELEWAEDLLPSRRTPLYVYCLSGRRSDQAVRYLREMGYEKSVSIGGVSDYRGAMDKKV